MKRRSTPRRRPFQYSIALSLILTTPALASCSSSGPTGAERTTCLEVRALLQDVKVNESPAMVVYDARRAQRAANETDNSELQRRVASTRFALNAMFDGRQPTQGRAIDGQLPPKSERYTAEITLTRLRNYCTRLTAFKP